MSRSNHPNYAKIGLVILLGAAAVFGTLVYLGGAGSGENLIYAETYSDNPVSGLSVGSEVNFRGVKVGEVKGITFVGQEYDVADEQDARQILIVLALHARHIKTRGDFSGEESLKRFVDQGLRATVTSSGITGLSRIELNYPKAELPPARISWRPQRICIPSAPSMLDSFSASLGHILHQLEGVDIHAARSNLSDIVSSVSRVAADTHTLLEASSPVVAEILGEVSSAAANLRALSEELRDNPSLLLRARDAEELPETSSP